MYAESDLPIKSAKFQVFGDAKITIEPTVYKGEECFRMSLANAGDRATFSREDWADFTKLVNRINKQLGN